MRPRCRLTALGAVSCLFIACAGGDVSEAEAKAELTPEQTGVVTEGFSWKTLGTEAGLPTEGLVSLTLTPQGLWVVGGGRLYRQTTAESFTPVNTPQLPTALDRVVFADGVLWALGHGAAYSADLGTTWQSAQLPAAPDGEWIVYGAASLGAEAYLATNHELLHCKAFAPGKSSAFEQLPPLMGEENGYQAASDVAVTAEGVWATSATERGYLAQLPTDKPEWIIRASYNPFRRVAVRGEYVWVATGGMGIWRSTDAGESFNEVMNGAAWDQVAGISPGAGSVWAAAEGGAIYCIIASGEWEFHGVQEHLSDAVMLDVAYDEAKNTAYFATASGLAVGVKEGAAPAPPEAPVRPGVVEPE